MKFVQLFYLQLFKPANWVILHLKIACNRLMDRALNILICLVYLSFTWILSAIFIYVYFPLFNMLDILKLVVWFLMLQSSSLSFPSLDCTYPLHSSCPHRCPVVRIGATESFPSGPLASTLPPVLAEMSGITLSSANETSEDVDEEDEFGYSWSKLSVSNALTCKRYQIVHSSGSLKAYAPDG